MLYELHFRTLQSADFAPRRFSTLDEAIDAAVKAKAVCTREERKSFVTYITDASGDVVVTNGKIDEIMNQQFSAQRGGI